MKFIFRSPSGFSARDVRIRRQAVVLPILLGTLVLAALSSSPSPVAVAAEQPPVVTSAPICGTYGNYFLGKVTEHKTSHFGARATIDRSTDTVECDVNTSGSVVWVLIGPKNNCNSSHDFHAQIGNGKLPTRQSVPVIFTEWVRTSSQNCYASREFWGDPGTALTYSVYRNATTGHVLMGAGGEILAETSYDTQGVWNPAWSLQFAGETLHKAIIASQLADYLSGTSSNKTKFTNLQKMDSSGIYTYITGFAPQGDCPGIQYVNSDCDHFLLEPILGQPSPEFKIWDSRG